MASTKLTRSFSTAGNRKTYTISFWVKLCDTSTNATIINVGPYSGDQEYRFNFRTDRRFDFYDYGSGAYKFRYQTNRRFRDVNAWYHFVIAVDTTQSTDSNRVKIYVNGTLESNYYIATHPSQNLDTNWNIANNWTIGATESGNYTNGCLSHFNFCDGSALAPTVFGSTDSTTGEWKIKTSPSVSYGTNGFFILKDGNSVTDQSGQSNNWTVGGGTLTKTEDCPSNVFATWSALHTSQESISNVVFKHGNTGFDNNETTGGVYPQTYSTLAASSGKYYFESKLISTNGNSASFIGISGAVTTEAYIGENAYTYAYRENGVVRNNDTDGNTYTSYGVNDIIQVAVDLDNNKLYFGINGTWVNSGDPTSGSTGTGAVYTITAPSSTPHGVYHFTLGDTSSSGTFEHATNFGNGYFGTTAVSSNSGNGYSGTGSLGIFQYQPPTGYTALSTKGLNL